MKAYVYNVDTNECVAVIEGETNQEIEDQLDGWDTDEYGLTYSPTFGFAGGLKY